MKVQRKVSVAGAFARKKAYEYEGRQYEADIKNGDSVEIVNAGDIVEGQFGQQHVFSIKTRNGEKNVAFNQTTLNTLIDAWGDETSAWVGKPVTVFLIKTMVSGKLNDVAYFAPEGYEMNDDGRFVREQTAQDKVKEVQALDPDEVPW